MVLHRARLPLWFQQSWKFRKLPHFQQRYMSNLALLMFCHLCFKGCLVALTNIIARLLEDFQQPNPLTQTVCQISAVKQRSDRMVTRVLQLCFVFLHVLSMSRSVCAHA